MSNSRTLQTPGYQILILLLVLIGVVSCAKKEEITSSSEVEKSNGQIVDAKNRLITASSATGGEFVAGQVIKLLSIK
ncbi:MAG: hypothetical protein AAGH46_08735 [Bacteroidota bacterium]